MSLKFSLVDPLSFPDHAHLRPGDTCYYLGEYTARRGYSFSSTNQLILNLKKKPTATAGELYYKQQAIFKAAGTLRVTLAAQPNLERLLRATLIPIPPSAICGDPRYDDRMTRVLCEMGAGLDLDIRELVKQRWSMTPVHECEDRPRPEDLIDNYYVDEDLADPPPAVAWIFDDLLTAGSHFKAVQSVLCARFPGLPTIGIFIARRVPESDDFQTDEDF